ncbi:MAG: alpha/beta hydrolase [Archaeoglobaceae archaeon]
MNLRFGFFNSNGLKIRYLEIGKGEPLILIHGLGECIECWTFQLNAFATKYRVIALDLRGFGMSDVPRDVSFEDFANDVKNLMNHLDIKKAHILGISMGGVVCFEFYKKYSEKVKSLILANTFYTISKEGRELYEERLKLLKSGTMEDIANFAARISFHQNREDLKDFQKTIIKRNNKEFYTKVTLEIGKINYESILPTIKVPTLVIVAEFDITTPPEIGKRIAELIPNAELRVVRGAAHLARMEKFEDFNNYVLEFLQKLKDHKL